MVLARIVVGATVQGSVGAVLNTTAAQRVAELTLAVLLFADAIQVRSGRLWGRSPGLAARMLLIAMPVGIVAALLLGLGLFPALSLPALLVLACIVIPIDFAPSEGLLRDRRLSGRLRNVLNVEGGYNDGIVSPVFLFALALVGAGQNAPDPLSALTTAVPHALIAVGVGLVVGAVLGWTLETATGRGWTSQRSRRLVVLLAPFAAYTAALATSGNGFVAAFVCGIAFRYAHRFRLISLWRRRDESGERSAGTAGTAVVLSQDVVLLTDLTALLTMAMWFVVGIAGVFLLGIVNLSVIVFCVLALTVLRVAPVWLALLGSPFSRRERLLAGLLGPRGTTTIVFGLIAFNALPDGIIADTVLTATLVCVLLSVLVHGFGAEPMIGRLARPDDLMPIASRQEAQSPP